MSNAYHCSDYIAMKNRLLSVLNGLDSNFWEARYAANEMLAQDSNTMNNFFIILKNEITGWIESAGKNNALFPFYNDLHDKVELGLDPVYNFVSKSISIDDFQTNPNMQCIVRPNLPDLGVTLQKGQAYVGREAVDGNVAWKVSLDYSFVQEFDDDDNNLYTTDRLSGNIRIHLVAASQAFTEKLYAKTGAYMNERVFVNSNEEFLTPYGFYLHLGTYDMYIELLQLYYTRRYQNALGYHEDFKDLDDFVYEKRAFLKDGSSVGWSPENHEFVYSTMSATEIEAMLPASASIFNISFMDALEILAPDDAGDNPFIHLIKSQRSQINLCSE